MRNIIWLIILCLTCGVALSQTVPNNNHRYMVDPDGLLSSNQRSKLNEKFASMGKNIPDHPQVVALIMHHSDDDIDMFSTAVFDKWKPGVKDVDNGLLLVIFADDKKYAIKTGKGTEGRITDLETADIRAAMRNDVASGSWYKAINTFAELSEKKLVATTDLAEKVTQPKGSIFGVIFYLIIGAAIFVMIFMWATYPRKKYRDSKWNTKSYGGSSTRTDDSGDDGFLSGIVVGSMFSGGSDSPTESSFDSGGGDSSGGGGSDSAE